MRDPASKISVLLVEDHRLMFEGLTSVLSEFPDINVAGVATTVADAVEKALVIKPDVVLMDYRLPDGDGAQATEKIRAKLPDTAFVFLSADVSESAMMRAVEAGASGYVSKAASAEDLVTSIRKAADGEFLLDVAIMARLLQRRRQAQRQQTEQQVVADQLTPRERDVLRLLARGLGTDEVANELHIGYGTVRGHERGELEKLGAHSRLEAVAAARRAGLVEQ